MTATLQVRIGLLLAALSAAAYADGTRFKIYWPSIALDSANGERIESVEIRLVGARFRGVLNIPDDWSLEIVSPSSAVTTLRASAGHGATTLWNLEPLDGSIVLDEKGSEISVTIKTTNDHVIRLSAKDLVLKN